MKRAFVVLALAALAAAPARAARSGPHCAEDTRGKVRALDSAVVAADGSLDAAALCGQDVAKLVERLRLSDEWGVVAGDRGRTALEQADALLFIDAQFRQIDLAHRRALDAAKRVFEAAERVKVITEPNAEQRRDESPRRRVDNAVPDWDYWGVGVVEGAGDALAHRVPKLAEGEGELASAADLEAQKRVVGEWKQALSGLIAKESRAGAAAVPGRLIIDFYRAVAGIEAPLKRLKEKYPKAITGAESLGTLAGWFAAGAVPPEGAPVYDAAHRRAAWGQEPHERALKWAYLRCYTELNAVIDAVEITLDKTDLQVKGGLAASGSVEETLRMLESFERRLLDADRISERIRRRFAEFRSDRIVEGEDLREVDQTRLAPALARAHAEQQGSLRVTDFQTGKAQYRPRQGAAREIEIPSSEPATATVPRNPEAEIDEIARSVVDEPLKAKAQSIIAGIRGFGGPPRAASLPSDPALWSPAQAAAAEGRPTTEGGLRVGDRASASGLGNAFGLTRACDSDEQKQWDDMEAAIAQAAGANAAVHARLDADKAREITRLREAPLGELIADDLLPTNATEADRRRAIDDVERRYRDLARAQGGLDQGELDTMRRVQRRANRQVLETRFRDRIRTAVDALKPQYADPEHAEARKLFAATQLGRGMSAPQRLAPRFAAVINTFFETHWSGEGEAQSFRECMEALNFRGDDLRDLRTPSADNVSQHCIRPKLAAYIDSNRR